MSVKAMVELECDSVKIDGSCTPGPAVAPQAPPPRRPRVREVSSRFMSPVVPSSTSSGNPHVMSDRSPLVKHSVRSSSVQRRRDQKEAEVLGSADENRSDGGRSSPVVLRKPHRAAVKLFKENIEGRTEQKSLDSDGLLRSSGGIEIVSKFMAPKRRPDTPVVSSSFVKLQQNRFYQSSSAAGSATPAAARQLPLGVMPSSVQNSSKVAAAADDSVLHTSSRDISSRDSIASDISSSTCSTSPILLQKCRTPRQPPDQVRSSMPESTMSMTVSSRYLGDRTGSRGASGSSMKTSASPCCRSLNMSMLHGIQHGPNNGNNLPPHPPGAKAVGDAKVKKVNSQQESIHSLRFLYNRYLQWRFSNAKAEASMRRQTQEAEKMLYSLSIKMSELRESVTRKRAELGLFRRSKILFSILEAQMPDLNHWGTLEEDFGTSLSEIINALLNASIQLQTSGNIKVDVRDFREALSSALKVMEMIESDVSSFMPKAAEMDKLVSELARVNSVERNYIEESGEMLYRTHMLQVEECSSIAQLIQLQQRRHG
uniref:Protein ENDOSPERM DEFECTIVE 1 n=1 Tax=Kalanchoe fedtschenkoi TaxID=63787 RepID=A0A7N0V879_KALFE